MESPVVARNLSLAFGRVQAVQDVSLEVEPGELFGLIGPDGAGKTTTIRILISLLLADEGEGKVLGFDLKKDYREIRKRVGYVPGHSALYSDLSVWENLHFYATVLGSSVRENYPLIKTIFDPLQPFKDRPAGKLSGGMRQKLALSCALIHRPALVFLDEPSTGVDPVSRFEFWETIHEIKDQGITIIVATPYMDEAARCDRIALMQQGKVLAIERPDQLANTFEPHLVEILGKPKRQILLAGRAYNGIRKVYPNGEYIHATFSTNPDLEHLENYLIEKGIQVDHIALRKPAVEDIFIEMT